MEYVIAVLLLIVIVRNVRKDRSDGRDYLGGGGASRDDVHLK